MMACRIGITTDLTARKAYWANACGCFKNWKVLGGPFSRKTAQALENKLAAQHDCDAHGGGSEPDDGSNNWFVYYFEHCGCKE